VDVLIIAHVALWVAIAGLLAVLVVLARQVAGINARVAPAGALSVNALLSVGETAPRLVVKSLEGKTIPVGAGERSQLLLFLAPDCPISRSITPVLATLTRSEPWLDVLLVSDGEDQAEHRTFADSADLAGLDYALSEPLGRAYGVSKVPYAILIDEQAKIAAMGIVNSREHLESLFEAKERGIASIQAFMSESDLFRPAVDASGISAER
jgi:methylamine dehydrogenase accessory protein MauD